MASFVSCAARAAARAGGGVVRSRARGAAVAAVKFTMLFASLLVVYFLMLVTMTFNGA